MTVLIDSWAWIEYFKGDKHAHEAAAYIDGDEEAYISSINITEVYSWILRYYDDATAKTKLKSMEERCNIVTVDRTVAVLAAALKQKHHLGIADSITLATSKLINSELLTGDPDMKHVGGVRYIGE